MIKDLIENYDEFHDALITEIKYFNGYNFSNDTFEQTTLKISLSCFNIKRDFNRDLITIYCEGINRFIFDKHDGMIYETMMKDENGEITLDFSHESDNDYFVVKCQKVTYQVIEEET